ncbi:MAG TPA: aspartate/glutamate racemase family protein, partial [Nitrospira sp.]|nr:aspartate/glutamate racemase family protein [Nitrospira sp.]
MFMTEGRLNHVPHIGIVAGTADGAALCYRTLCHEADRGNGRHAHPEITMHALPLESYLASIDAGDWSGVAALMSRSASVLAHAGAELIICPNNTLHRAFDLVVSPVPWVHIAAAVAAEATRRNYQRVGLLGTQVAMQGTVYQPIFEHHGIEIVLPPIPKRIELNRIIRTELIRGHYLPRSRADVQDIISTMAASGADAVILGCTELPL